MILEFLESWSLFSHTYISALLIGSSLSIMGVVVVARGNIFVAAALAQAAACRFSKIKSFLIYNLKSNHTIPRSGLNFIINKNYDKNFLLLCGFEKFKDFFVRIDILEKLFIYST